MTTPILKILLLQCQLARVAVTVLLLVIAGPILAQSTEPTWALQNRFVEVFAGHRQQDYREVDDLGLTTDGTLDRETGQQEQTGLALRWQTASGWLIHIQGQRESGVTNYNGYLQSANASLLPFRARTGNTATHYTVALGYGINASTWSTMPDEIQIAPLVQLGQSLWSRELVQYQETYNYNTWALGALAQWRVRPGTVFEVEALAGRTQPAKVSAASLAFAAQQSGNYLCAWQVGVTQDIGAVMGVPYLVSWSLSLRYASMRYGHGASPVVNGLQAPPNEHRPDAWTVGLKKQF